jgi:hypothetical protein
LNAAEEQSLWQRLEAAELAAGAPPAPPEPPAPWFVRVMLGVAGWIAALFLVGTIVLAMGSVKESFGPFMIVGSLLCAGATVLSRVVKRNDFVQQLALAGSLAGQFFFLIAFADKTGWNFSDTYLPLAAIAAALFLAFPTSLHRVWSAAMGTLFLTLLLRDWLPPSYALAALCAAPGALWLYDLSRPRVASMVHHLAVGVSLTLMVTMLFFDTSARRLGRSSTPWELDLPFWPGGLLVAGIFLWVVYRLQSTAGWEPGSKIWRGTWAVAGLLAIAAVPAPGVGAAAVLLWLGVAHGYSLLAGLGTVALVGYLLGYYYILDLTLLAKSWWLLSIGAALLVLRQVLSLTGAALDGTRNGAREEAQNG